MSFQSLLGVIVARTIWRDLIFLVSAALIFAANSGLAQYQSPPPLDSFCDDDEALRR